MDSVPKKSKKFRPFKVPRYLPGQVDKNKLITDLNTYNQHRYNVFKIKPRIDNQSPPMNPFDFIKIPRLLKDALRLQQIDKENKNILKKINTMNRMGGRVDTFNPIAYARRSRWRAHSFHMKDIVIENRKIYDKVYNAKSVYPLKTCNEFWEHCLEKLQNMCKFDLVVVGGKTFDQKVQEMPSISSGLDSGVGCINRPMCYIDFRVKEGVYLGRIIIELYQDYVPVTVQNFMSICCNENNLTYLNCIVHKVSPGEYIETGDITKGNGKGGTSIFGNIFDEENYKLKHSKPGVLSAKKIGNGGNNSQFCITLAPMPKLDNRNVVFGQVLYGNNILCKLNDLGRKFGKPMAPIIINNCGKFIRGKTPIEIKSFKYTNI